MDCERKGGDMSARKKRDRRSRQMEKRGVVCVCVCVCVCVLCARVKTIPLYTVSSKVLEAATLCFAASFSFFSTAAATCAVTSFSDKDPQISCATTEMPATRRYGIPGFFRPPLV